jgi:hypothetical protein
MQKKHGKDGLVGITVSMDSLDRKALAEGLLKKLNANNLTNLLLNEDEDWVFKKLNFLARPCVFVFNRQGKWVQFTFDQGEGEYERIDKTVEKFLSAK